MAFAVAAEAACFLALGWPLPANILDLYAEHLLDVNGLKLPPKLNGLIAVMARHRLPVMTAAHKDAMRNKVIHQNYWAPDEVREILAYCADDVDGGERLLMAMTAKDLIIGRVLSGGVPIWLPPRISSITASQSTSLCMRD